MPFRLASAAFRNRCWRRSLSGTICRSIIEGGKEEISLSHARNRRLSIPAVWCKASALLVSASLQCPGALLVEGCNAGMKALPREVEQIKGEGWRLKEITEGGAHALLAKSSWKGYKQAIEQVSAGLQQRDFSR